jgi:hypothetical protein
VKPIFPSSSGVRPALPMGVAPEAFLEFLFEYRLSICFVFSLHNASSSSGAHSALPMGVAPEAIMGCLHSIIGSKILRLLPNIFIFLLFFYGRSLPT